jgi:hypothetical protein
MKLQQYNFADGGELMATVAPKLDVALTTLKDAIPDLPFTVSKIAVRLSAIALCIPFRSMS